MKISQMIGVAMLAAVFIAMVWMVARRVGWMTTLKIFGSLVAGWFIIVFGAYLAFGGAV